jgi:hypothetical protein
MLSLKLHTRIGEQDLLLPRTATSSSPPLPVRAGWRGGSPSLDATRRLAAATYRGNAMRANSLVFRATGWASPGRQSQTLLECCKTPFSPALRCALRMMPRDLMTQELRFPDALAQDLAVLNQRSQPKRPKRRWSRSRDPARDAKRSRAPRPPVWRSLVTSASQVYQRRA